MIGTIFGLEIAKASERPPGFAESWPEPLRSLAARARTSWDRASAAERAVWGVAAANAAVFALWRLPLGPLSPLWREKFMSRHFVQRLPPNPPPLPHTMLTANFSHQSSWHLAANTVTLLSIGELTARNMDSEGVFLSSFFFHSCFLFAGRKKKRKKKLTLSLFLYKNEKKTTHHAGEWQFWAFYGAAGCASSLASHLGRLAAVSAASRSSLRSRVAAAALASAPGSSAVAGSGGGSLGASGSLYACVTMAALNDPDMRVAVPFFEGLGNISIGEALLAILALDAVGVARGWRRLDHWGHLGGAAAGAAWASFGGEIWRSSLRGAEGMRAWARGAREEAERKRRERERRRREVERERRR